MIRNLLLSAIAVFAMTSVFAQTNVFPAGDFEAGNLDVWGLKNPGAGIEITQESVNGGSYAAKLTASATSSNAWDLQLATPILTLVKGDLYRISFDIRSEGDAKGRISLGGADQFQNQYWPDFTTNDQWQTITYTQIYGADLEALGTTLELNFDLGYLPDMVYYLDNVKVEDMSGSGAGANIIPNGTFDSGIDGWAKWNGGDNALSLAGGANVYEGDSAMMVVNETGTPDQQWNTQIHTDFANGMSMDSTASYQLTFYIRSEAEGSARCSTSGDAAHYQSDVTTTTDWQKVTWNFVANGSETGLNFDLGAVAGTYYIDNVELKAVGTTGIADQKAPVISVYPNPASNVLYVKGLKTSSTLKIMSITGQVVRSVHVDGPVLKVDVSSLRNGLYVLTTDQHQQFKFTKN